MHAARKLRRFDVLCIGVNAIVGSGVFALPDDVHRQMGGWSPLAFFLCALLLVPVALCFAELSSRTEESGGPYVFAHRAFGPAPGFIVGWLCWQNSIISWAALTTLFVELCGVTSPPLQKLFGAGMILGLGAVNYLGVKPGTWIINAVTIGKLTAIACFIVVGLSFWHPDRLGGALPLGLSGVGNGIYLCLFPLQGFEVVSVPAGEAQRPQRDIPFSTLGSLLFAALLFVVVQAILVMSYPEIGVESETPLVDAAQFLGPTLGLVVLIGGLVSIGGFTAGGALGAPRYAQAIALAGQLPKKLSAIHPRFGTPHVAIVATTLLAVALTLPFDYRDLVGMSNITVVFQYAATCLAVPILRREVPKVAGAFRVPGGLLVPGIGAVGSAALIAGASVVELAFAAGTLLLGFAVFKLSRAGRLG